MKKKIIIAASILVLLGAIGYIVARSNKLHTTNSASSSQMVEDGGSKKSLKDLLSLGAAQKCTYDGGVVYVSSGKMRGDFEVKTDESTMKSHVIVDGKTSYFWTEGTGMGVKFVADDDLDASDSTTNEDGVYGSLDAETPMNYVCSAWIVDNSLFALPTDVDFSDMSTLMPSTAPGQTTVTSQCSFCDSLSGTQKAECLSALNCE
jgi:hypothetical protein